MEYNDTTTTRQTTNAFNPIQLGVQSLIKEKYCVIKHEIWDMRYGRDKNWSDIIIIERNEYWKAISVQFKHI